MSFALSYLCAYSNGSETVEEASKYENEIKRLNFINSKLLAEINDLKNVSGGSGNSAGADMPQILSVPSAVISTLARKVTNQITTQLGSVDSSNNSNNSNVVAAPASLSQFLDTDTLDDSMRKVNKYVRKQYTSSRIPLTLI